MTASLRVALVVFSLAFFVVVLRLVTRERLRLKYSLLWMALAVVLLLCALFPKIVGLIAHAIGVELSSNFVFLVGLVCLLGICLSLTVIVSWQARDIRQLIQRVALLEKELRGIHARDGADVTPDERLGL